MFGTGTKPITSVESTRIMSEKIDQLVRKYTALCDALDERDRLEEANPTDDYVFIPIVVCD